MQEPTQLKPYQFITVAAKPPFDAMVLSHPPESNTVLILRLDDRPVTAIVQAAQCTPADNIGPFDALSKRIVAANRKERNAGVAEHLSGVASVALGQDGASLVSIAIAR